jgi:chemotaxis family two-component system response regulator Rcp1
MQQDNQRRPREILLVEDNPGDALLARECFGHATVPIHLSVVPDGEAALDFLYRRGAYAAAPRPDLVLLDLNLPGKNGHEVLAEIKADAQLRCIPVIVLSSSQAEQDIQQCYTLHANCYVTKPVSLEQFLRVVRAIEDFWLTVVQLPRRD